MRPVNNRINIKRECDFVVKQEQEQMYACDSVEVAFDQSQPLYKLKNENIRIKEEHQRDQLKWQKKIQNLTEINTECKSTIRRLTYDNKLLKAQNKQLQSEFNRTHCDPIQQNVDANSSINVNNNSIETKQANNDVYEVEQLVSHKTRNGIKYFLIRWKGYDASFDTWEREENLNCQRLLKNYSKSLK